MEDIVKLKERTVKLAAKYKVLEKKSDSMRDELKVVNQLLNSFISIIKIDKSGHIIDISKKFQALFGYSKKDLLNNNIKVIEDESNISSMQAHIVDIIYSQKALTIEHKFIDMDEKIISCDVYMTPYMGIDGSINGYNLYIDTII